MNFPKKRKKCPKIFTWRIIEAWRRGGNGRKRSMLVTWHHQPPLPNNKNTPMNSIAKQNKQKNNELF
jgi:hypothetical protein